MLARLRVPGARMHKLTQGEWWSEHGTSFARLSQPSTSDTLHQVTASAVTTAAAAQPVDEHTQTYWADEAFQRAGMLHVCCTSLHAPCMHLCAPPCALHVGGGQAGQEAYDHIMQIRESERRDGFKRIFHKAELERGRLCGMACLAVSEELGSHWEVRKRATTLIRPTLLRPRLLRPTLPRIILIKLIN